MDPMYLIGGLFFVVLVAYGAVKLRKPAPATSDGMSVEAMQAVITRRDQSNSWVERYMKSRSGRGLIERNLVSAGLMLKPYEFIGANLFFLVLMLILDAIIMSRVQIGAGLWGMAQIGFALLFMPFLGWRLPQMVLQFMADRRRGKLEVQLSETLTLVASSLKGGYSFIQGLSQATEQLQPPITEEITRVVRLIQLGLDTPRALEQMAQRVNSYDYDITVSATNIQLSSGGNLAQLLEKISETIRDRIRLRRDIAVLTAQGRMSGAILIALPIAIALMLNVINHEYFVPLYTTDFGKSMLIGAGLMQAIGIYWIKKLLDFDS